MKTDYLLIDKYLVGELSGDVLRNFEMKMKTDQDFANKVNLYKSIDETMRSHFQEEDRKNLKETLKSVGAKYFKEDFGENTLEVNQPKIKPNVHQKENASIEREREKVIPFYQKRAFQGICAVAAVLCFVMLFFNPFKQNATSNELYASYQELPQWNKTTRSDIPTEDALLVKASENYNQQNYEAAINNIELHLKKNPQDSEALFYIGIAKLKLGKTKEAIAIFKPISEGRSSYSNDARWQLALSYLKIDEIEKSREILKQIPTENSSKSAKAGRLLKELP